jgi:hypothetical protein
VGVGVGVGVGLSECTRPISNWKVRVCGCGGKMRVGEIMNSQVNKCDSRDCIAGQCVAREVEVGVGVEVEVEGGDRG